jgi:transcriptional regulator with XRE-family HTH domain
MFAERLKEIRNGAGMTQVQLAEALGVSKGTVAMWEVGKREPNYETLNALSGIFDKRIDYILGYSNDSSSARISEEQVEQLGAWAVEDDAQEEFMDIMALDEYGKMAVRELVRIEKARCRDQGTLIPTDNVEVAVRLRKK